MYHLDRRSFIPLYHQLKEKLIEEIESGTISVGQPLPTEMELIGRYAVSRTTVRQAMQELEHDGYITRTPGKGTFVIRTKLSRGLTRLTSFTEDMLARGMEVTSSILEFKQTNAPAVCDRLGIPRETPLLYVYRLRHANGVPVAINASYINTSLNVSITREELDLIGSLYALYDRKGIPPLESDKTIQAVAASEEWSQLLHLPVGSPLLLVEGVVYTYNHQPLEYHQVISGGDRYKYTLHLQR